MPHGFVFDAAGTLYIADDSHVRTLAGGVVDTLAGGGGDKDGTGSSAGFNFATSILLDGHGDLLVSDNGGSAIRQVTVPGGVTTTIYGTLLQNGYADQPGTAARFYGPTGFVQVGGKYYVADIGNQVIREIDPATHAVSTIAGTPKMAGYQDGTSALFSAPYGLTTDGTDLYIADSVNRCIRKLVLATKAVTTLAGACTVTGHDDGLAAHLREPIALTWGPDDTVYIADWGGAAIRRVYVPTGAVSTFAGQPDESHGVIAGSVTRARLSLPAALAFAARRAPPHRLAQSEGDEMTVADGPAIAATPRHSRRLAQIPGEPVLSKTLHAATASPAAFIATWASVAPVGPSTSGAGGAHAPPA